MTLGLKVARTPATAANLLDKALRQITAGKMGAALEALQRAQRDDPANPQVHYNVGVTHLARGDGEAAAIAFVRALGFMPTPSVNILLGLGNAARLRGEREHARQYYERVLGREPGNADAARNLGVVLAEMGDLDAAMAAFERTLARAPRSVPTLLGLAQVLVMLGRTTKAVDRYRQALEVAGDNGPFADAARDGLRTLGVAAPEPTATPGRAPTSGGSDSPRVWPSLLSATDAVLEYTAGLTSVGFEFVPQPGLRIRASIQIARGGMAVHRITYRPDAPELDHLVAHECGHLVRLWTVEAGARALPTSDRAREVLAIKQVSQELADLVNGGVAPMALSRMFHAMYAGLIHQVTNMPIDLRIERWLHGAYPGLHAVQRASLLSQLRENAQALSPQITNSFPATIVRASNTLNCAFARGIAQLYDDPSLAAAYEATPYLDVGDQLLEQLDALPDDADGDCAAVDAWARALGVQAWYEWRRVDTLSVDDATVSA